MGMKKPAGDEPAGLTTYALPDSLQDGSDSARVNDWVNVVRRAQLAPTVKLVALVIASYANPDGSKVFPGIARLTVQTGLDSRTVQRAMATLRKTGLIQLVRRGARRAGKSDEYRLTLAADVLERITVLSPAAERLEMNRITERWSRRSTRHPCPVEQPADGEFYTSPVTSDPSSTRQGNPVLHVTRAAPPSIDLYREPQPPSEAGDDRRNGAVGDPRTREGTEQIRLAAADALTRWELQQAASP